MPNRLAREPSPYLRQHANNPVDWYPWGDEAFAAARERDCPIFLSVGYATCHWCHVMEHESFEHDAIAALLNDNFVSIKVDREERPDVDRVYMTFVQATTGQGGWPMSVWLTPDLRPFFGGTYFPPDGRWGRPGFAQVLRELSRLWREERPRILASGDSILSRLRAMTSPAAADDAAIPSMQRLQEGAQAFARTFDERFGGFGQAPKFPRPSELLFLLRMWRSSDDAALLDMVDHTLRGMALGGMRDQVGGGFHRYSVDREWHVPHFEKMLYDQAQLIVALIETWQATGDDFHRWIADDTIEYVLRDMTHPDGGFYSAEDADSVPPAQADVAGARPTEGAFYLWHRDELERLLGADAAIVAARFNVRPGGNVDEDPHGEFGDGNILHVVADPDAVARATGRTEDEVVQVLTHTRETMRRARAQRPRPLLDDKILTSWNGLMIGAIARAARTCAASPDAAADAQRFRAAAERAASFVRAHLWNETDQRLWRRWRDGDAAVDGFAEDYACLAWGVLELFQATGDAAWLSWADTLLAQLDARFGDEANGGWFSTTGDDPSVLLRLREDYDGAEPSATAIGTTAALTLEHLRPAGRSARIGRALTRLASPEAVRVMPWLATVVAAWHDGVTQIVIVGDPEHAATQALHAEVARRFLPASLVVAIDPASRASLTHALPWSASMDLVNGQPAAYVCRDFACLLPVTSPDALGTVLDDIRSPRDRARGAEG